jgi:PAS domain S-box-containing protein
MASDGPGLLIIDDQDDVRLALRAILSLDGWSTQEAASGEEALARIDRERDFDALVLDYRMPDLDGLEVARRARASGFERPIVICSAYLDPNVEREARAVGAQSVSKDNLVELRAAVRRQLGGTERPQSPEGDAYRLDANVQSASDATVADENYFRSLLESAPDAAVIVAADGNIAIVNRKTEELFGYRRQELLGQPVDLLVPGRFRDGHAQHRKRYFDSPKARPMGADLDLYGMRRDGTEFPVEISLSPLRTRSGAIVSAAIRDVTERRRVELRLQRALVTERKAAERLRELDRLKDDFLSTVSHELRTPLTVICALTEVMRDSSGRSEEQAELLARISKNASEMNAMVEGLLDYSRLEAGKVQLEIGPLRVRDAVSHCVELAHSALAERHLSLQVANDLEVAADERGFERILVNLLTNAAKYSREGSTICVIATAGDREATIAVTDEGIGITATQQARIFDRFYQGAVVSGKRGTGLGLSIVRRYVELLGGRVWVESEPGRGSRFSFNLPLSAAAERSRHEAHGPTDR